jgi:hypothetical protein
LIYSELATDASLLTGIFARGLAAVFFLPHVSEALPYNLENIEFRSRSIPGPRCLDIRIVDLAAHRKLVFRDDFSAWAKITGGNGSRTIGKVLKRWQESAI